MLRGRLDTSPETAVATAQEARPWPAARKRAPDGAAARRAARVPIAAAFAGASLVTGVALLVFAAPAWTHGVGAVSLLACAVTVFALVAGPSEET